MKAMKAAASGGMMRGPRGGMYRIVGGKKVYGGHPTSAPKPSVKVPDKHHVDDKEERTAHDLLVQIGRPETKAHAMKGFEGRSRNWSAADRHAHHEESKRLVNKWLVALGHKKQFG